VRAFALLAEQAEELDGFGSGGAEPVRCAGVELGRFAGGEHQLVLSKHEAKTPVEHVQPLVALVGLEFGLLAAAAGRNHVLVRLNATGSAG